MTTNRNTRPAPDAAPAPRVRLATVATGAHVYYATDAIDHVVTGTVGDSFGMAELGNRGIRIHGCACGTTHNVTRYAMVVVIDPSPATVVPDTRTRRVAYTIADVVSWINNDDADNDYAGPGAAPAPSATCEHMTTVCDSCVDEWCTDYAITYMPHA
jgi:hypothetical protein